MEVRDRASVRDRRSMRVEHLSTISATAAIAIAALVLLGWVLDVHAFERFYPGRVPMTANTALGILLAGGSLLLLRGTHPTRRRSNMARICAAILILLATGTASQDLFGWNLGVDELLFDEPPPARGTGALNRMAPNAAVAFVLVGTALLLQSRRERWSARVSQWLAITVAVVSYLAIVGYLYGASGLYWIGRTTAMASTTAFSLLLLSVGILCSRPHAGLVTLLLSQHLGGQLARRLIPAAVLVPTVLGQVRVIGQDAGLYDTQFGTAALISATVLLFGSLSWWTAEALDRLDAQRVGAMDAIASEGKARDLERRRLRAVLEVLPVGVFLADASGRLVEINGAARAIWSHGTPLARDIPDYGSYKGWRTDGGAPLRPEEWAMARSLTRGEVCVAEEVEIEPVEGQRKTILNYAAPIRDEQGSIAGGVAVNIDITNRKQTERELRSLKHELEERVGQRTAELAAANAELEAYSYSVSHDLRAPLRWVDGFTQALAEDYAEHFDERGRDYVRQIRESVHRMSELIDALLKLSRITRAPLERADVNLSQVAREIASELDASDPARHVAWEISEELHAEADPRLARVILDNLLRNAWKFTRTRELARIQVGGVHQEREQIYFVRDNGVGFDMAYVDKLFRSFERLHRTEEFEGTGVGLALVKRVAQRHGGRAWAEGQLNKGAAFFFTLGAPMAPK